MAFSITSTLSESATTKVVLAFDEALHRRVLLKVLHRPLAGDPEIRERFVREARACAALRSDHIVQVYDLTEVDGAPAIVMEYVGAQSLKEFLALPGNAGAGLARRVAEHVLRALAVAHARGIVHRDIKPGNILVSPNGNLKVTDFGLASVATATTLTADGTLIGTPAYLAPEAVRGDTTDHRADLFSLGATVVEALSGDRLFGGATYGECLSRISSFRTSSLDRYIPLGGADLISFLRRLMDPDPERRFSTADQALSALTGQPIPPPARSVNLRAGLRRLGSVAAVLSVAAAGLILWMRFAPSGGARIGATQPAASPSDPAGGETIGRMDSSGAMLPSRRAGSAQDETTSPVDVSRRTGAIADSGSVRVNVKPWAHVFVDNRSAGETPLARPLTLARGTHTIVLTHPSFGPVVRTIEVRPGRTETVAFDFLRNAAYLTCSVTPWAEVYVDDAYRDTTPLQAPILVSAGIHRVRFHHAAFRDTVCTMNFGVHDTLALTITLVP